jgi:ankyrin repeat protein
MRMVNQGQVEAVRVLLEQGADVTARDPDGRSLFEIARDRAFDEIAGLLERYGR